MQKHTQNITNFGYPFGMSMVSFSNTEFHYSYGMNTQEKDEEIYGEGNSYSAEYWQYDARLGRRWNVDPRSVPSFSPYSCFANNPIWFSDVFGDSAVGTSAPTQAEVQKGDGGYSFAARNNITPEQLIAWNKDVFPEGFKKGTWIIHPGQKLNTSDPNEPSSTFIGTFSTTLYGFNSNSSPNGGKPADVSNTYEIKIYGSDIFGQGYGTIKMYSTYDNPSGMPSWQSVSSGWSIAKGFGPKINFFTGVAGTMTFNADWIRQLNPSNISDISNSVSFSITIAGSIATGFYGKVTARDPSTGAVLGRSNMLFGGGLGGGGSVEKSRGEFKESPTDTFNTFLLNLKYGRGDTAAFRNYVNKKKND